MAGKVFGQNDLFILWLFQFLLSPSPFFKSSGLGAGREEGAGWLVWTHYGWGKIWQVQVIPLLCFWKKWEALCCSTSPCTVLLGLLVMMTKWSLHVSEYQLLYMVVVVEQHWMTVTFMPFFWLPEAPGWPLCQMEYFSTSMEDCYNIQAGHVRTTVLSFAGNGEIKKPVPKVQFSLFLQSTYSALLSCEQRGFKIILTLCPKLRYLGMLCGNVIKIKALCCSQKLFLSTPLYNRI